MFDQDRQYNRPTAVLTAVPTGAPILIKHVHSSLSYQRATYQKYDWRGHELPSGYGA